MAEAAQQKNIAAEMTVELLSEKQHRIGEEETVSFTIRNCSDEQIPASRIVFPGNNYYLPFVMPSPAVDVHSNAEFKAVLQPRKKIKESDRNCALDLVESSEFQLEDGSLKCLYKTEVSLHCADILADQCFIPESSPWQAVNNNKARYKIMVFGQNGCGKSSWLNSLISVVTGQTDRIISALPVSDAGGHCTKQVTRVNMARHGQRNRVKFDFYDLWGWDEKDTFTDGELPMFLQGALPLNLEKDTRLRDIEDQIEKFASTAGSRAMHAIMLFISFSMVDDEETLTKLKTHYQKVKQMGMNPIVMLARIDQCNPDIRKDPSAELEDIEGYRTKLANALGIGKHFIYLSVPYVHEEKRSFYIDRYILYVMDAVLYQAKTYVDIMQPPNMQKKESSGWEESDSDSEPEAELMASMVNLNM